MQSWLDIPQNSDFSIYNLPYGIFSYGKKKPRAGVAIGNFIIDLKRAYKKGLLEGIKIPKKIFDAPVLNDYIRLGKSVHRAVRERLQEQLQDPTSLLFRYQHKLLVPMEDATMHLPVAIGDYTDFYSSEEHATNVGKMFRGEANALMPNWKHLPVAYHGRASSIVVSGTPIRRPMGQYRPNDNEPPVFGPSQMVDFELEVAFIISRDTELGERIPANHAEDYIFGLVLFNDWSARDLQKWEYVPLGPFLGKNFGSSMSPWIVTLDALEPFRTQGPVQNPPVLPYLQTEGAHAFDIHLEVAIIPQATTQETVVCRSNFKYLYWNMAQQLAHHTVNGCNVRVGDVMASGTISGPAPDSFGSMLELTWNGKNPILLQDGSVRTAINDYDEVVMRGYCQKDYMRVGFGEVRTLLLPAE
ncbi:MAG: fumarylacetoacetase [Cytophagales bacterium]|nr:fumarylacetoacetase [Bernardetiaceae bacterium]MDW8203549.1 fumarylacetoacetase [Cytophagales bacterium]